MVRHTQALLAVTEDPRTKLGLLEHVATIHSERRNDPQRAIAAYLEALKIWPDERSIMHRLLELYTETKQWKQSVQLLARLASWRTMRRVAPTSWRPATSWRRSCARGPRPWRPSSGRSTPIPTTSRSFERIDQLVTEAHDWKTQERTYRRQIKRIGARRDRPATAGAVALWHGLGEIYRTRLKDVPAAIAAFEVAAGLDPEAIRSPAGAGRAVSPLRVRRLIRNAVARAPRHHRSRAKSAAEMGPDLRMLVRLFVEMGTLDEAHGAAAALVLLGQADAEERALYEQYRPNGVVRAHARLTEEVWQKQIYHPEQDRALSQILATLSLAVATARARLFKETGLKTQAAARGGLGSLVAVQGAGVR